MYSCTLAMMYLTKCFFALVSYVFHWSLLISNFVLQTFCKALISLRNNGVLLPMVLLDTFFQLFSCPDKVLRKMMYNYVVQDIKNVNTRQKNVQLNKVSSHIKVMLYFFIADEVSEVSWKNSSLSLLYFWLRIFWFTTWILIVLF